MSDTNEKSDEFEDSYAKLRRFQKLLNTNQDDEKQIQSVLSFKVAMLERDTDTLIDELISYLETNELRLNAKQKERLLSM